MVNFKLTINLLRWVGGWYTSDFNVILVQVKLDSNIPNGTELSNISAFLRSFKRICYFLDAQEFLLCGVSYISPKMMILLVKHHT